MVLKRFCLFPCCIVWLCWPGKSWTCLNSHVTHDLVGRQKWRSKQQNDFPAWRLWKQESWGYQQRAMRLALRGKLAWLDEGFGLGQVGCRYFHQCTYSSLQSSNIGENSDTYWAGWLPGAVVQGLAERFQLCRSFLEVRFRPLGYCHP